MPAPEAPAGPLRGRPAPGQLVHPVACGRIEVIRFIETDLERSPQNEGPPHSAAMRVRRLSDDQGHSTYPSRGSPGGVLKPEGLSHIGTEQRGSHSGPW